MKQKERCDKIQDINTHLMHLNKLKKHLEDQKKELGQGCTHKLAYGDNGIDDNGICGVCERQVLPIQPHFST